MPDVHPGKVGTIGLTMTIGEKIIPNLIGIDIGCGMTLAQIKGKTKEYRKLDTVIRDNVPSGFSIRAKAHRFAEEFGFSQLACAKHIRASKAVLSLGSRHLGKEVTERYLKEGQKILKAKGLDVPYEITWLKGTLMEDYPVFLMAVTESFINSISIKSNNLLVPSDSSSKSYIDLPCRSLN